jgi:FLVCR family MFS transporter 7
MKPSGPWIKMDDVAQVKSNDGMLKNAATIDEGVVDSRPGESSEVPHVRVGEEEQALESTKRRRPWARKRKSYSHAHFKVYKRRWFGLAQLVLLNIVVSWDVSIHPILPSHARGTLLRLSQD